MNEEIIRKLLQKMADIIAEKNGIKIVVNIERKEWKEMIKMYSLFEIAFFILYFATKITKFIAILLLIQIAVYRLSGFSIYKFAIKKASKLLN